VRIERLVTSGVFSLDGGSWEVDNNVWIIGDDREALVIDAAHDADTIAALGSRRLVAIVSTHGHDDHIDAAPALAERTCDRLLTLPAETVVHTGHGPDTTIGAEAPHLDEWLARGH
jgi:glyoxylase-like metal-dependent hydrolase (beta-lactamase superfamily II)